MSERSGRVRYQVEDEKRNSTSISCHVLFCLLYLHSNDDLFDDFLKIPEHFLKICEDSVKVVRLPDNWFRTFPENFRIFSKTTEDFRGRTDDVSLIQEHFEVLVEGLCNSVNSNCDLFTSENNVLFSRVKILCLRAKARLVFHWCSYNKLISETEKRAFLIVSSYDTQTSDESVFQNEGRWCASGLFTSVGGAKV